MESSRAKWTDARLDDLVVRIDRLESKMDARFNSLDAKFDRLQQTLIGSMASVVLAFALQTVFG
jgi:hypothetical protein